MALINDTALQIKVNIVSMFSIHFDHADIVVQLLCIPSRDFILEKCFRLFKASPRDLGLLHCLDPIVENLRKGPAWGSLFEKVGYFVKTTSYEGVVIHKNWGKEGVPFVEDLLWLGFHFLGWLCYVNKV